MNLTKTLGFLAVGGLLMLAAPTGQAQAASLINPGVAASVQDGATTLATQVQYRHRHHRHWHHRHWRPRHHWHHRYHHRHWHHRHWR
jgi:hypothetical protein